MSQLLELKVDEINDLKTFQTQNGITSEFKCSIFNKNISNPITNFVAPFITNINTEPLTAGTRTLLTINGTNLWPINVSTKSEVWFTNAYSGNPGEWIKPLSGDYKSVSDTKIEVYVPTNAVDANSGTGSTDRYYAGTGSIKVVVKNTPNVSSNTKSLKIKYAVKNDTYLGKGQPIFLCKNNDKNGYTIGYTTAFKNKTDAKGNKFSDAFARAIKLWQCKTGLNFIIDANNTNPDIIIGLIDFPLNSISTLASTRITSFFPDVCDLEINNGSLNHPETFKVDFAKKVITIDYNSNYLGVANSLEAGISENIEIAGLHELGHAHCILHVNEANELMNWQLSVSNKITTEAENASNYIINHSVKQKCSQGSFEKYDCKTTTTELDINLNIYAIISEDIINLYNPNKHNITKISILDIQGRVILENNYDNIVDEIIPFKSPITQNGIYFLIVKSNNGTKSIKFSKINN